MRKIISLITIAALVLINFNLLKASFETSQKLSGLNVEEAKVKDLQTKNDQLSKELAKESSDYFIEQEARNLLGYGRAGETSIVMESSEIKKQTEQKSTPEKSNLEKWVDLVKF
ncbi:MAG TPA: hypothetical protein VLE47_00890 [Candidatus Saccharimonadales bacterium]|nr:hypothetical protein [Candidatus Saccharimonadales bacterium]